MRVTAIVAAIVVMSTHLGIRAEVLGANSRRQVASQPLSFETATVRPANSSLPRQMTTPIGRNGQFVLINQTLRQLVGFAFHIPEYQIAGGPDWANTQLYDVTAQMPVMREANGAIVERARLMMRTLLSERFNLATHPENRDVAVYFLTTIPGKTPTLQRSKIDCGPSKPLPCGRVAIAWRGAMFARAAPMAAIARMGLSTAVNGIVLDRTGLTGNFDVDLEWRPAVLPARAARPPQPGAVAVPTIFEAVEQQLGLRLEKQQSSVEFLVIDRAEAP